VQGVSQWEALAMFETRKIITGLHKSGSIAKGVNNPTGRLGVSAVGGS